MPNLVLSRRVQESLAIDGPCRVTVVRIRGSEVSLAIRAERDVKILRCELEQHPEETESGSDSNDTGPAAAGETA